MIQTKLALRKNFYILSPLLLVLLLIIFPQKTYSGNETDSLLSVIENSSKEQERISAYQTLTYKMMWQNLDSSKMMLDSLRNWIGRLNLPKNQIQIVTLTGTYHWFRGNHDTALSYYHLSKTMANRKGLKEHQLNILSNLGALLNVMGQSDSAAHYLDQALQLAVEMDDKEHLPKIHFDLGSYYHKKGFDHLALEHYLKAVRHHEAENDSVKLVFAYTGLGNVYQGVGDFKKSRYYSMKALEMDKKLERVNLTTDLLNNLGVLYWKNKRDLDSARMLVNRAIEASIPTNNQFNLFAYMINLGGIEMDAGNFKEGLASFKKAAKISPQVQDNQKYSALIVNTGINYKNLNNYDSAEYYLKSGLQLALESKAFIYARNAYKQLFIIDSIRGNYLSAIGYLQAHKKISDSLSNENVRNKIAELDIIYETEKKEQENELLRTKNELNERVISNQRIIVFISLASLIMIAIFVVLLLKNRRKRKKANHKLESQNKQITLNNKIIEEKNRDLNVQKEQLTNLNQTKDKFFSVVAHDLRSPFNSLLGYLEILEDDFNDMDDKEKLNIIKTLHNSSRNTYNLLVNLLEWSRSQRGLIEAKPEKVGFRKCSDDTILFLEKRIKDKNQIIDNRIPTGMHVFADPNLTVSILTNLINNAIKFTPRGGKISLEGRTGNGKAEITISDTGIGIPTAHLQNLFSISSGISRAGTENEPGTGLGLVMVREFVELMNGSIRVESVEKKGTTFYITLPTENSENG